MTFVYLTLVQMHNCVKYEGSIFAPKRQHMDMKQKWLPTEKYGSQWPNFGMPNTGGTCTYMYKI